MILRLAPRARGDLADIWHYSAVTWSPDRADNYLDALRDVLIQPAHNPRLGLPAPEVHPDLYRFPHASHVIYYRTVPDGIEVAPILHQRMEPGRHL